MTKKLKDYVPAMRYGAKIYPEDLAGMIGLPYVGNIVYIDPTGGSDGNGGGTQDDALATVGAAEAKLVSGQHDVAIIAPTGGTGRTTETTAIGWDKRFTHLVGSAAPVVQDVRAGINFNTGGSLIISNNGCLIQSVTFQSSADIDETVSVTGSYNSFGGVDFKGTYNATSADSTPWRALNINGGQENYFSGCTFGSDTMSRGAANATLEFESAASRNVFEDCRFVMHNDAVNTPVHILLTGSSAIDRWIEFKNCSFYSFWTNYADKTAGVIDASAQSATGDILLTGTALCIGFDDWEASASSRVWLTPYTSTANAIGLAVNNA